MALPPFELERRRLEAARSLPSDCFDEFQRLSRSILHGPDFQWLLVDAPADALRQRLITALDRVIQGAGWRSARLPLSDRVADAAALEQRLVRHAQTAQVVHVLGRRAWFTPERWQALNIRRERIAAAARVRCVLWLDEQAIEGAAQSAPDLWAWRGGVYAFRQTPGGSAVVIRDPAPLTGFPSFDPQLTHAARHRRIAELRDWLADHPDAAGEHRLHLLVELGKLQTSTGSLTEALATYQEGIKLAERISDDRARAVMLGYLTAVLQVRGELDEAQRIIRESQLPTWDRLGDTRERAIALSQIADILNTRGSYGEALRVRREEVLPIFERLGDQRSRAVTLDKIAVALLTLGEFDEALRILRDEALPILTRLGEARECGIALGHIADILQARGEFDDALRIWREQALPIFERLGDQRERAVALGRIAEILQARGDIGEALRIRREEQLPVLERLGDRRSALVAQANLALGLLRRQAPGDRQEAQHLLLEALAEAETMQLPEAEHIRAIERTLRSDEPESNENSGPA